jgi:hypothetical protein
MYGIIEYDSDGYPICEICKKSFKRVLSHVRQVHFMNEKDYKTEFGFDLYKGICSKESAEISRLRVYQNYNKCIENNLLLQGNKTRFKKNSSGRTKDKVSEQTRLMLIKRLKEPKMVQAMRDSGKKVGLSGLGNLKRWDKDKK